MERTFPITLKKDPDTGVLYLRLRPGTVETSHGSVEGLVEESVELAEGVYLDLDKARHPIGIEFLSIEDFEGFLDTYPEGIEISGTMGAAETTFIGILDAIK